MQLYQEVLPGWIVADEFSSFGNIVLVTAGAGIGSSVPISLTLRDIPPGSLVLIESLSLKVVDPGSVDQIFFGMKHHGMEIFPFHKINAKVVETLTIPVYKTFGGGPLEIVGKNISGTTESGAVAAVNVNAIGSFVGYLLRETKKSSGMSERF